VFPEKLFPESGKYPAIVAGLPDYYLGKRCQIAGNAEIHLSPFNRVLIPLAGLPDSLFPDCRIIRQSHLFRKSGLPAIQKTKINIRKIPSFNDFRIFSTGFPQSGNVISGNAKVKAKSEKQRPAVSRLFFCALRF
jgi:hypothetical protein